MSKINVCTPSSDNRGTPGQSTRSEFFKKHFSLIIESACSLPRVRGLAAALTWSCHRSPLGCVGASCSITSTDISALTGFVLCQGLHAGIHWRPDLNFKSESIIHLWLMLTNCGLFSPPHAKMVWKACTLKGDTCDLPTDANSYLALLAS